MSRKPRQVLGRTRPFGQQFGQGAALDELHREIRPAVDERAQLVDRDDAGVLQLAADLGLLDEPADQLGVLAMRLEQDLDGQVAAEVPIATSRTIPIPPRATSPSSWSRPRRLDGSGIPAAKGRTTGS